MILGYQVNVISLGIVDDFVQPYYVGMLQSFENLKLFFYVIIGISSLATGLFLQSFSIHLLNRILRFGFDVFAKMN